MEVTCHVAEVREGAEQGPTRADGEAERKCGNRVTESKTVYG
jgi:hypothetical protein